MKNNLGTICDVIVVDPKPQDYEKLVSSQSPRDLQIRFMTSGDEALRSATRIFDGLWLINTRLPDMTGVNLLMLIHQRDPKAVIFLVGDSYDQEDEISARSSGPTAYVCKPPHPSWLSSLRPDVRAGPGIETPSESIYTQSAAYY